jgi:hypothetical protein
MLTVLLTAIFSLTTICVDNYETLIKERAPRPVVVAVLNGSSVQRVEAFTYLQQTKRLTGEAIRWERASIAVQVAIARHPFKEPGDLVDYITGASAFVDTPVLRLQVVPRITLAETITRYLLAKSPDDRRMYGELLYAVSENRANSCSFWR